MHLVDIVPNADVRRVIYRVFAFVGLVIGGAQVVFASVPGGVQPVWLTVVLSVYAFLGGAGFSVAQSRTVDFVPFSDETVDDVFDVEDVEDDF